jgi:hypothetical protein
VSSAYGCSTTSRDRNQDTFLIDRDGIVRFAEMNMPRVPATERLAYGARGAGWLTGPDRPPRCRPFGIPPATGLVRSVALHGKLGVRLLVRPPGA